MEPSRRGERDPARDPLQRHRWSRREEENPASRTPPPKRLGDTLDSVVSGLAGGRAKSGSLLSRWPDLVGPDVAANATPVGIRDGELIVAVTDPVWATQLRWLERDLLTRIAERGGPRLDRLTVRHRPS